MLFRDETFIKTVKALIAATMFGAAFYLAYELRSLITWLGIGLFLAIIINPAVGKLTKYMPRKKRGFGVAAVLLIGMLLFSFLLSLFLPPLIEQSVKLVENFPEITQTVSDNVQTSNQQPYKFIRDHGLLDYFNQHKEEIIDSLKSFFGASLKKAVSMVSSIGAIFTIAAMTVYMSINGPKYAAMLKARLPKRHHKDVEELTKKMYAAVTGYVNGNLLTSSIAGITCGVFGVALGLPYPALLGLIVGITDLIPMIGATLGATIVVLVTLFSSVPDAVIMTIFFIVYQQIENYVLVPRIVGKTVEMSSFAVFVAALAGGMLAGFVGALVAIPIGACIQILATYIVQKWQPVKG